MVFTPSVRIQKDIEASHGEIQRSLRDMFDNGRLCAALMMLCYIAATRNDPVELARIAAVCAVSLVFAMALGHHSSERHSAWLRYVDWQLGEERQPFSWEFHKAGLRIRPLIVVLDLGLLTAPLYVAWQSAPVLWNYAGTFGLVCAALVILALILNAVGIKYAGW